MLYLEPPYLTTQDGVVIARDYHDDLQFYYFPNAPHLATTPEGKPAIRFITYKADLDELEEGEESAVGFLMLDTVLSWDPSILRKAADEVKRVYELDDTPRLAPVPLKEGTCRLMFLGQMSELPREEGEDAPPPAGEERDTRWVTKITSPGVPALYGDNRAIFSVQMTKEAAALLHGSFDGFIPAGVLYELKFVGLKPAFRIKVRADWERAYHYFEENTSFNLIFVEVSSTDIIQELEEKKIIEFDAENLDVDGEDKGEFEEIRRELQRFVLETFFEPVTVSEDETSTSPVDHAVEGTAAGESTGDQILAVFKGIRDIVHMFGKIGYSRMQLDVSDVKRLEIDWEVRRAVTRRINPQAHLHLFFQDGSVKLEDILTVVEPDKLFDEIELDFSVNADFGGDGIHAVTVDVAYGGQGAADPDEETDATIAELSPVGEPEVFWSFVLDKDTTRARKRSWYAQDAGTTLRYRYTVHFAPDAVPGPEPALSSGWITHEGHLVVVTPRDLYSKREVEAVASKVFPFDAWPEVHVHMRYEDAETGWVHEDSALLSSDARRMVLPFRLRDGAKKAVDWRATYLAPDGDVHEQPWESTEDDLVVLRDPLPRFFVRVMVAGDRATIANILVDLRYEDEENGFLETGTISIDPSNIGQMHQWVISVPDLSKKRYWVNQTIITTTGDFIQTGWLQSEKQTLVVGLTNIRWLEVEPSVVGESLGRGVEAIRLKLSYRDDAHSIATEKEITWTEPGSAPPWRVLLGDPANRAYSYTVEWQTSSGFNETRGPTETNETFLVIPASPPR